MELEVGPCPISLSPAVLEGFEADEVNPPLRYCDGVTFIPNGCNGVAAYAGSDDARAWVEVLEDGVQIPPNLRDCHWRLVPRRTYIEAKALNKLAKRGTWDEGKCLPWPEVPGENEDLDQLADRFVKAHKLQAKQKHEVREVLAQLQTAQEENDGNLSEEKRQAGNPIRYGDAVQVLHVSTDTYLRVTKAQAIEQGSKRVELVSKHRGTEHCVFVVMPAYKTYISGEVVSSGDLVTLHTKKAIGDVHFYLHMSQLAKCLALNTFDVARRQLQLRSPKVVDLQEINAVTASDKTFFRFLVFQRSVVPDHAGRLPLVSEDMVTFYHKEAEAYLHLDMADLNAGRNPCFRLSTRTSEKARKKSTWLFKIESEQLLDGASRVVQGRRYRIKHVISDAYLIQDGEELKATQDYTDPRCLFTFKQFDRSSQSDGLWLNSLVFIRGGEGAWLTQLDEDAHEQTDEDPAAMHDQGIATERVQERKAKFVDIERGTPEREALLVCPVRPISKKSVIQVRRAVLVLKDFQQQITKLEQVEDSSKPGDKAPATLPPATAKVLEVTEECYLHVYSTLRKLVVNCTIATETDPLVREGAPNRLMQKLLREADTVNIVFTTLKELFERGLGLEWFASQHDARFGKVHEIIVLMYRLLKQMAKGDSRNSWALYQWLDLIKSHLGKGLSTNVTLKEMYLEKRQLLKKIQKADIEQFMQLLKDVKDPRYIDFLLSICTCEGEPLPSIQGLVCSELLALNNLFLPTCKVEAKQTRRRLGIHLPGTYDKQTGSEFWIDIGVFCGPPIYRHGQAFDVASLIMSMPTSVLNEQQKLFRYFIRCISLYGKLALGRNQTALGLLLKNPRFSLLYDDIYQTISNENLPPLVRAKYFTLMLRLYVDRDPQSSRPQVLYTRKWSEVIPDKDPDFGTNEKATAMPSPNPECTDGFESLQDYLLRAFDNLGGIRNHKTGEPAQNITTFMLGELEMVLAMIELCDWLVDFSFFVNDRDSVDADFSAIKRLIQGIFRILDTDGADPKDFKEAVSAEERMRLDVRIKALELLGRLLNLRANYRISVALNSWEKLFAAVEGSFSKLLAKEKKNGDGKSKHELEQAFRKRLFSGKDAAFKTLEGKMFNENCISPKELSIDTYKEGSFGKDKFVKILLNLYLFKNTRMTCLASQVLIRHMAQRMRVIDDLSKTQVLVLPAAVKVYEETAFAIKRLTALKKKLAANDVEAYAETMTLLKRMTDYMQITIDNPKDIVQKNQKIMLNRELDEPIVDLLRLNLEADDTLRKGGEIECDSATNIQLRDLFQACYNFLKLLCMHRHTKAQEKLFPLLGMFSGHMGIMHLNVADTLQEIVKDNPTLCAMVKEDFYRHFVYCILTYGRKPRWLAFFEVFISIRGNPSRRNQDKILRLLLEEREAVIDLECDYTSSPYLSKTDERTGMKRLDLMIKRDHKIKIGSLLKYHYVSVSMLAKCCTGRNAACKSKVSSLVGFDVILNTILNCHLKDDGKTSALDTGELDYDAACYVKHAWTQLMEDAFLSSFDSLAVRMVQGASSIWYQPVDHNGLTIPGAVSLMDEWLDAITRLTRRLSKVETPKQGGTAARSGFQDTLPRADSQSRAAAAPADAEAQGGEGGDPGAGAGKAPSESVSGAGFGPDAGWIWGPNERGGPGTSTRGLRSLTVHGSDMGAADPGAEAVLRISLCGSDPDRDLEDEEGKDLGTHFLYVKSIISALSFFLSREDMSARLGTHEIQLSQKIFDGVCRLQKEIVRLNLEGSQGIARLLTTMMSRDGGVLKGSESLPETPPKAKKAAEGEMTREQMFQMGWSLFREQLADNLVEGQYQPNLNFKNEIRDMARMYGSRNSPANENLKSLKLFMQLLCDDECADDVRRIGVKVVRAVLYLNPDKIRSTAKQDFEYERYFLNKEPSGAGQKRTISKSKKDDFREFQIEVAQGGGVQVVVACLSSKEAETQLKALQLGCTLLAGGNTVVQDLFYKQLSPAHSQSFFSALKSIFDAAVENIKEAKRKAKQLIHMKAEGLAIFGKTQQLGIGIRVRAVSTDIETFILRKLAPDFWKFAEDFFFNASTHQAEAVRQMMLKAGIKPNKPISGKALQAAEEEEDRSVALMSEVMKFMRRSCFGQHKNMQDVLRVQRANRESFNFYLETVQYIQALEPDIKGSIATGDTKITESAIRGLLMLAESMKGPNYHNQQEIATSGIFDTGDRMMCKLKYVNSLPSANTLPRITFKKKNRRRNNQVMDDDDDEAEEPPVTVKSIYVHNETRCRLKMAILKVFHSILEGVQGDSIPRQMLSTVDWSAYAVQMKDCYDMRYDEDFLPMPFDGDPSPDNPDVDNIVDEGISYYFLFKFLEKYQGGEAGTPLTDVLANVPTAARYFEARKGYVEIIRDNRLERVFFRLPDACVEDGPLNKPYDDLYGDERDDADKKTTQFLENMIRLVSKEKFLDKIRDSIFSFTINKWESIMMLCFYWGGLLHLVLVFGSYAPYHGLLVTERGGEGSSKAHYSAMARDSVCEEENCWNQFFVVKLYMCYVYAGLCALRYFSFLWAHVPLIILDGKSSGEAEEEADDNVGGSSEEHLDEDEREEVLFVEDLDLEGEGAEPLEEDVQETTAGGAILHRRGLGLVTSVMIVLRNKTFLYETVFAAMGALAVGLDEPLFTVFFWCDLAFFKASQTVVNAIVFKAGEMLNTLVLGLAIMYLWMVVGIVLFRENHLDNNQPLCVNMFQCTLAYVRIALRGDGVADLMDDMTIPLNIVDSVSTSGEPNERFFLPLLIWDFTYNWLFIYILLAIITGIVIDAFGGMREAKEAAEANLKAVCYVCNLEKFALDQGPGFERHVKTEHNPRWYLFFLIYIDNKRDAQLTGQEKYVKSKVWPQFGAPSGSWIPRERTDSVQKESEEDPNGGLHGRINQLEDKLCSALARIEDLLASSKDGANEEPVKDRNMI